MKASEEKALGFWVLALGFMSPHSDPLSVAGSSAKEILENQFFPNFTGMSATDGHCEVRPTLNTFQSTGMNSPYSSYNGKNKACFIDNSFNPAVPIGGEEGAPRQGRQSYRNVTQPLHPSE